VNKTNIDEMIPQAIQIIKESGINKNGIDSKYFGYIDNFGAMVRQSSLTMTLSLYKQVSGESDVNKTDRKCIYDMLENLLIQTGKHPDSEVKDLFTYTTKLTDMYDLIDWQNRISEGLIALKLAIKLFKKVEPDKKEEN